jgi:4-hydroxy-tetrahydrodipicolinate reductase
MRVLLIGHGRMGRLVEALCPAAGLEVAGIVTRENADRPDSWGAADVAIDFSAADGVLPTLRRLSTRGTPVAIGTTGWQGAAAEAREIAAQAGIGVVAAPNFAVGVHLFARLAAGIGGLMRDQPTFGAWIHELHHAAKRDAPSGTARLLEQALRGGGFDRPVDIASTRAGAIPGTHTIGFDSPGETITLTHTARDRSPFALGAIEAAKWVHGRRGWFGMEDVIGHREP